MEIALSIDKNIISPTEKDRFCCNCQFVLGNRFRPENWREWKCSKTKKETGINLVSGEKVYEVSSCSYQRAGLNEETCGVKGIWFEVYIYPKDLYKQAPSAIPIKQKLSSLTLDDL